MAGAPALLVVRPRRWTNASPIPLSPLPLPCPSLPFQPTSYYYYSLLSSPLSTWLYSRWPSRQLSRRSRYGSTTPTRSRVNELALDGSSQRRAARRLDGVSGSPASARDVRRTEPVRPSILPLALGWVATAVAAVWSAPPPSDQPIGTPAYSPPSPILTCPPVLPSRTSHYSFLSLIAVSPASFSGSVSSQDEVVHPSSSAVHRDGSATPTLSSTSSVRTPSPANSLNQPATPSSSSSLSIHALEAALPVTGPPTPVSQFSTVSLMLEEPHAALPKALWKADSDAESCDREGCTVRFGMFTARKHHCRK